MIRTKSLLASAAVAGLIFANPVLASSPRSINALPAQGAVVSANMVRAAAPVVDANEQNPQRTRLLLLFGLIGAGGLLIAASSGGGNDSPG